MNKAKFLGLLFAFCLSVNLNAYSIQNDTFIDEQLSDIEVQKPKTNLEYDYSDTDFVKIPLRITEKITTQKKNKSYEGQKLTFIVDDNIYYENKLLVKKGTIATARLEIITTKGFAGIPAEIFITDFEIENLDSNKIKEPVSKRGFSMTALIFPIKWALTPFPPMGSLVNLAVGFNASLTPKQILDIYYYPNY